VSNERAGPVADLRKDWKEFANCRGLDYNIFFPSEDGSVVTKEVENNAKAVCWRCSVRDECLEYAITTGQEDGIWGGMTYKERRSERRRRRERLKALV